jgi:tetratricopeptide (TPR) repeat protein
MCLLLYLYSQKTYTPKPTMTTPNITTTTNNNNPPNDTINMDEIYDRAAQLQQTQNYFNDRLDDFGGENYDFLDNDTVNKFNKEYYFTPDNPHTKNTNAFAEAKLAFKQGELKTAILLFEAVLRQNKTHAEAWFLLGKCHQESDEDDLAIICFENTISHDPNHLGALLSLVTSSINQLNDKKAALMVKKWTDVNPALKDLKPPSQQAVEEFQAKRYTDCSPTLVEVLMLLLEAEKLTSQDAQLQEMLGLVYFTFGDYDSALMAFENAHEIQPEDYTLLNKAGATCSTAGKDKEAVEYYQAAVDLRPGFIRIWVNLGTSFKKLQFYEDAIRAYLHALTLNSAPNHIWHYLEATVADLILKHGYENTTQDDGDNTLKKKDETHVVESAVAPTATTTIAAIDDTTTANITAADAILPKKSANDNLTMVTIGTTTITASDLRSLVTARKLSSLQGIFMVNETKSAKVIA